MNTSTLLTLARKHLGGDMESSARFCLAQAVRLNDEGKLLYARQWAVRSLGYSVGGFHPDHARAAKAVAADTMPA